MKISNNQNNVAFGTKFKFITAEKFNNLIFTRIAEEVSPSTGVDYLEINGGGNIYTTAIGSCTAYGLTEKSAKDVILGHYNKGAQDVTRFVKYFAEKGRAFVIGGFTRDMEDYFARDIEKFREAKVPTTIFWGQPAGFSNVYFDAYEDTCYIFKNIRSTYTKNELGPPKIVDSVENLKSAYEIINVSEGDEVYIKGKQIPSELINQNNENYLL